MMEGFSVPSLDGGGMVSGTWLNPRTSEIVTVRDSYIDGEDMVIMLTNGRTVYMDEFKDYVQIDEETRKQLEKSKAEKNSKGPKLDKAKVFEGMGKAPETNSANSILAQLGDPSLLGSAASVGDDGDNSQDDIHDEAHIQQEAPVTKNASLSKEAKLVIDVLKKSPEPSVCVDIKWDDYPKQAIEMLKEYFNVKEQDIIDAVIHLYGGTDLYKEALSNKIMKL